MAVKNYGFGGFTKTKTWIFALCSLVGDFPNTLLFTHLGGSVSSLVSAVKGTEPLGTTPKVGLALSICCTVLLLIVVGSYVKKSLREHAVTVTPRQEETLGTAASVNAPAVVEVTRRAAPATRIV
jgi:hypothetical protein